MSEGRAFTSRYRRGLTIATGPGCLVAPLLIVPGWALSKSLAVAALIAVGSFAVASVIANRLRRARPALRLTAAGVEIDGFGRMPWTEVVSVRRDPDARGAPDLLVRLRTPFTAAPAPRRPRAAPLWTPLGNDTVVIRAGLLEDPPGDVEAAFQHFLRG